MTTKAYRKELTRQLEATQAVLRGEEVNGVKLHPDNEEWARKHVETLARLLNGVSIIEA